MQEKRAQKVAIMTQIDREKQGAGGELLAKPDPFSG